MSNKINTALLVLSCDAYSDLWGIFIDLFEKNWPECPLDKYFVTNHKSIPESSFSGIKTGDDLSWSSALIKALKTLGSKYTHAFITLEDLPLLSTVENEAFLNILHDFQKIDGRYLKFITKPKPTRNYNSNFGIINKGSLYRPTCVYSLWHIGTLLDLLKPGENAWEFERFGSVRSDKYEGFYVVHKDFFRISNTVVKGKWVPGEKRKVEKLGYQIDNNRPTFSSFEAIKLQFKNFIFNLFIKFFPWQFRRKIVFKIKGYARKYNHANL